MAKGRKRAQTRRKGWLPRAHHHATEHAAVPSEETSRGEGAAAPEPISSDTPASLDQVLRHADEARRAERAPDE